MVIKTDETPAEGRWRCHREASPVDIGEEKIDLPRAKISKCGLRTCLRGAILLSGRGSGLISPSRTCECFCSSSIEAKKRERLMRPTGNASTAIRAGAIGDRGSAIATSGLTS